MAGQRWMADWFGAASKRLQFTTQKFNTVLVGFQTCSMLASVLQCFLYSKHVSMLQVCLPKSGSTEVASASLQPSPGKLLMSFNALAKKLFKGIPTVRSWRSGCILVDSQMVAQNMRYLSISLLLVVCFCQTSACWKTQICWMLLATNIQTVFTQNY